MSAYVVGKDHIDLIVQAMIAGGTDSRGWASPHREGFSWWDGERRRILKPYDEPQITGKFSEIVSPGIAGQILVDECVRSVSYRYPDDDLDVGELPGPMDAYYLAPYVFAPVATSAQVSIASGFRQVIAPPACTATIAEALRGYDYQACEHPEHRESEAWAIVCELRAELLEHLPRDGSPSAWEYVRSEQGCA